MGKSRRKKLIRMVETAAVGLVALDLVLYFAMVRPLRNLRTSGENQFTAARDRVRQARARVARLEHFKAGIPDAEAQLQSFLDDHVPARRQGYSRAMRMVLGMSQASKVRLASIGYKLSPGADEPLARVGLEVEVQGPFPNLLRFAHALETNKEFLALRDFSFEPGESRSIALHAAADLYLKP